MEFLPMRDFSEFCEQLSDIRNKFQKWDSCERTVALYYLMGGLPFANARFLQHTLEHCINAVINPELMALERNANDPNFIMGLQWERPNVALARLLAHLPLLRSGNRDAADRYLIAIRRVLHELMSLPHIRAYNECVELMSYVFVHPAFNKDDKKSFKILLKQIVNKVCPTNIDSFAHSPVNEQSSDESVSPKVDVSTDRLTRRSNSLTPAQSDSHESLGYSSGVWSSQENLSVAQKPRSYSLSCDSTMPPLSLTSSSSDTRLHDMQQTQTISKGIIFWLKSLRLHKYSWVFANLSYEQMLALTDEQLQAAGITKGARHKLLINISKLKERSAMLTTLETDVMNGGDLSVALRKLKTVLQSPLQTNVNEDLPSQFVKVMGKVCTQLLMIRHPPDDCLAQFVWLCDRAEALEAFGSEQRRRLSMWRSQLSRAGLHAPTPNRSYINPHNRHHNMKSGSYHTSNKYHNNVSNQSQQNCNTYNHKSSSYPNMHSKQCGNISTNNSAPRTSLNNLCAPGVSATSTPSQILSASSSHSSSSLKNTAIPTVPLPQPPIAQVRFSPDVKKDFPIIVKEQSLSRKTSTTKSVDIESSLENLCLQMMEHALGP